MPTSFSMVGTLRFAHPTNLFASIAGVSGILGHPPSRVTTTEYGFTILAAYCARFAINFPPSENKEGAGNTGCALHPRSRVQICTKSAHEHTGTAEHSGLPCAMALRLMPCSPRRRIRLVTVAAGLWLIESGKARCRHRQLDTSNGCQDHTVLPYASAPFVLRAVFAHGQAALRITPHARRCCVHRSLPQRS